MHEYKQDSSESSLNSETPIKQT